MMPTWARPGTRILWPGPWPWTSADGLSTRRYSAGRPKLAPSSKLISRRFSAFLSRSSVGHGVVSVPLMPVLSGCRQPFAGLFVVAERPCLIDQHDRDAVADRVGEPRLLADQLLRLAVVAQRRLGQRTDKNFEQFRIEFRRTFHLRLR